MDQETPHEAAGRMTTGGPSPVPLRVPHPLLILVGADKGGTGKTTVSRAVEDYLQRNRVNRVVFDGEYPRGDLKRFVPQAEVVNLEDLNDQMRAFDTVSGVTLVDLKASSLTSVIGSFAQVGLLDDIRAGRMNLALLHVLSKSVASLNEVAHMITSLGSGSHYYPVKNLVDPTGYEEWEKDARFAVTLQSLAPVTINVPNLPARVATDIQQAGVSFEMYTSQEKNSRMLRGYARDWLNKTCAEFDRVGLGRLTAEAAT